MAVNNGEFIPQFIIPSDPKTQWQNGDFFNKDHLTLWTMVKKKKKKMELPNAYSG